MIISSDGGPLPNIFEAYIVMTISMEGKQDDAVMSNSCMHTSLLHSEARIVCEPQMSPLVEAVYVVEYDVVEPLIVSVKVISLEV